jgi:ribose transport system permease protein
MKILKKLLSSDYGMLGVLVALCVFFSLITYENQQPVGQDAADRLLGQIQDQFEEPGLVIIAGKNSEDGRVFVSQLEEQLTEGGWKVAAAIAGSPIDLGKALREADDKKLSVTLLACEQSFADLPLVANMKKSIPRSEPNQSGKSGELWLAQLLEELESAQCGQSNRSDCNYCNRYDAGDHYRRN